MEHKYRKINVNGAQRVELNERSNVLLAGLVLAIVAEWNVRVKRLAKINEK